MRESAYQRDLIKRIEVILPGAVVLKNNPAHIQGMTDLLVLYNHQWAALEVKISSRASSQPNQDYWVDRLGQLSFSAFIYPENEEEVLNALQEAFGVSKSTRVLKS